MCCRYCIEKTPYFEALALRAQQTTLKSRMPDAHRGSVYHFGDISPGNSVPVLAWGKSGRQIAFQMFWGFSVKTGSLVVNARTETAAERPMFKDSWTKHRCIIPASWYYEWQHGKAPDGSVVTGQKYLIQPSGMDKTFLCGLYRLEGGAPHFAVLTREPPEKIRFIHDRMPLILPEELINEWIDPSSDPAKVAAKALTEMEYAKAGEEIRPTSLAHYVDPIPKR